MAENRNPTGDPSSAGPEVQTAPPGRVDPPRQRPRKSAAPAAATKSATSAKPAKAAKKTAKKATSAKPATVKKPAATTVTAGAPPGAWAAAGWAALRQPDQPPQRIAELVVAELGPRAAAWAGWLRATYPGAPSYGIARLATRDANRASWALAAARAGGTAVTALSLPAAAWARASVVLRIAAAYGHDPTDPRRAGELLELLGWGDSTRARLPAGLPGVAGRLGLGRLAIGVLGLRGTLAATAVRVLVAASDGGDRLHRLAHRAARFYRGQPGSTSKSRASDESISSRNSP